MVSYNYRSVAITFFVVVVGIIYIIRLFFMQVVTDEYKKLSEGNSQRIQVIYPARGLMLDRYGKILVENQPAYDLLVTPMEVKSFDTLELVDILGIDKDKFLQSFEKCRKYSQHKASIVVSEITAAKYARLQERLYKYEGFSIQTHTLRQYNVKHSADVFGYVGEIQQSQLDRDTTGYYASGDYVGITGLEKSYETYLRGEKGYQYLVVDNFNQVKGHYMDGQNDVPAVLGKNITMTLDSELQEYVYQLMQNKRGGIIAIEPATGEILIKASSPGYDPNMMVGLDRGKNYRKLQSDPRLPLFDRTLQATYPPGSTFKTLQALIGLNEGVITEESKFRCEGGWNFGLFMGCHHHISPLDLRGGIKNSCNPYFVQVWKRILESEKYNNVREAYAAWRKYIMQFGLGHKIASEFSNAASGLIPTVEFFDKRFKTQRWRWSYLMSLSIGQGEILVNPLQIANMACCIANRGYYITPHIVRAVGDSLLHFERHDIDIAKEHFLPVIDGMTEAAQTGTARAAAVDSVVICGKTGTAENPHGKDHSIFMVFAPRENPKIAMAIYIENGGFGAACAVPIGGLILEKYLTGTISEERKPVEERMMNLSLIETKNSNGKK